MARTKQTARKSVSSRPPRKQDLASRRTSRSSAAVLQCTYEGEVDPKYHTLQRCTLPDACEGVGIQPSTTIELDLEADTRQALSSMRCDKANEAVQVVKLMDPSTAQQIQMSKVQGRNCYVPTAAQAFKRGQPVGWFSGILQEKDKADRVLRRLDDSRHLWFYDIPASVLSDHGYTGPDLVLNMLHRGSELRFTHDAKWHNPNGSNNIAAVLWVLQMQLADGSTLPIPYIFCVAQQQIRKGGELLLDWGDECWAAYHQAQVVKQGGAVHRQHLKLKHLEQLAARHNIAVPAADNQLQQSSRTSFTAAPEPTALPVAAVPAAVAAPRAAAAALVVPAVTVTAAAAATAGSKRPAEDSSSSRAAKFQVCAGAYGQQQRVSLQQQQQQGASAPPAEQRLVQVLLPPLQQQQQVMPPLQQQQQQHSIGAATAGTRPAAQLDAGSSAAAGDRDTGVIRSSSGGNGSRSRAADGASTSAAAEGVRRIVVFDPDKEEFQMQLVHTGSSSSAEEEDEEGSDEVQESESSDGSEAGQEHVESEESGVGEDAAAPAAPPPHEAFVPVGNLQLQQQQDWRLSDQLLAKFDGADAAGGFNRHLVEGPLDGSAKVKVVDVVSVHHPARWCTPPNVAARAAVAAVDIKRGEAIIDYVGVVQTEGSSRRSSSDDPLDQAYCLSVRRQDVFRGCPSLKQQHFAHDLVIDCLEVGNEARFINCTWAREKLPDGRPHLNCIARVVWIKSLKRPAVRLFATRCIKAGEEVVADYGPDYWVAMGRSLQVLQKDYAEAALLRQEQVLQLLRVAAADGRLPAAEVEAAAAFKPNLDSIVMFEP